MQLKNLGSAFCPFGEAQKMHLSSQYNVVSLEARKELNLESLMSLLIKVDLLTRTGNRSRAPRLMRDLTEMFMSRVAYW